MIVYWDGGLWKKIRVRWGYEDGVLVRQLETCKKRRQRACCLCHVGSQWERRSLETMKGAPSRTWACWPPNHGLLTSRDLRKQISVFEHLNLWYWLWLPKLTKRDEFLINRNIGEIIEWNMAVVSCMVGKWGKCGFTFVMHKITNHANRLCIL